MTLNNKNKTKALNALKNSIAIGVAKNKKDSSHKIHSIGTLLAYLSCLKIFFDWCDLNDVSPSFISNKLNLTAYLQEKSEVYRQKTLDQHRMSLNMAYNKKLSCIKSELETILSSRNYYLNEVLQIISNLNARNAVSILICYYSGLRAHELATLQRQNEGTRSSTRNWSNNLFDCEENYHIYIVCGKGGLKRYVALPKALSEIIESRRYDTPRKVCDRGIYYSMNYDIGFGRALSQSFSRASFKFLGWSCGLHGLRHSYTQNRVSKLTKNGYQLEDAKFIVSQELGHFRADIVSCYLR